MRSKQIILGMAALLCSITIANANGVYLKPNVLWHNSTTGAVEYMPIDAMVPSAKVTVADSSNTNLIPVGNGDLTGDSNPDILFHNQNSGKVLIWEMDGLAKVKNTTILETSNTYLRVAGLGDFDGDGDNDIATFNINSGTLVVWVMDGTTKVRNETVLSGLNVNLRPQGVGDMNNDGKPDIVLRNDNSGAARVWLMNQDFTRKSNEKIVDSSNTNLQLRGVIDINQDGNQDIMNYNTNTGKLRAWIMDGNLSITDNAEIVTEANFDISPRGGLSALLTMNDAGAKDAMALNAIVYPIAARLSTFPLCFDSIESLKTCLDLLPALAPEAPDGAQPVEPGNNLCTTGSFDYSKTGETYAITFNDCVDDANKQRLHEDLVLKACVFDTDPEILPGNPASTGTYQVIYNGTVTCTPEVKTAENYTYRTIGNTAAQKKQQWTYDGTFDITSKVLVDGSVRGLTKYGEPGDDWDGLFLGSDEEWQFASLSATLGDTMTLDGKYSYLKHPNANEPDRNETETFYMNFDALAYTMIKSGGVLSKNIDVNISGRASASCYPEVITYTSATVLEDEDTLRDINNSRMPSVGDMTISKLGYYAISAAFDKTEEQANVSITSAESTKLYNAWREITTGSTCQGIQDIIDSILPNPEVPDEGHSKIIEENVLFEKEGSLVLSNGDTTLDGETDGHAVWYFVAPGNGYANDGSQTVLETTFDLNVTKAGSTSGVFVSVYLKDDSDVKQKVTISSTDDWKKVQQDHPTWTIRSDYWESNFNPFAFYNGNFILRFGDSTYKGEEAFHIEHYDVKSIIPLP